MKGGKQVLVCAPMKSFKAFENFYIKASTLNKNMQGDVKKSKVYVDPDGDGKAEESKFW